MTKQTWTAIVAALLFMLCATLVALTPVPYAVWSPGSTYDLLGDVGGKPLVGVTNASTHPTTGELRLTTVNVTAASATVNLVAALAAYWMPANDALPSEVVYPTSVDPAVVEGQQAAQMDTSQTLAVVAGLSAAGLPVSQLPMVTAVTVSGPSADLLQPGDLFTFVDHTEVKTLDQVRDAIVNPPRRVGDKVTITFLRGGETQQQTITTRAASATEPGVPSIGVEMTMGYTYKPQISFGVDPAIGGSSGGLMFSLAVYDKLTDADIARGRIVAGTGTITADGAVGPIGGVNEKIAAATRDGATVFVLPRSNCADLSSTPSVRLLAVSTLKEAITALTAPDSAPNPVFACS